MNKLFLLIISFLLFFSCSKEDSNTASVSIKLNEATIIGDSIVLNWSVLNSSKQFEYFSIVRNPEFSMSESEETAGGANSYIDITAPVVPEITYFIIGKYENNSSVRSNTIRVKNSTINLLNIYPNDALYDSLNNNVILTDQDGKIVLYSMLTNSVIKTIYSNANIGRCDLAIYKDSARLFVPRNDGWIFIYNSRNLELIDQINVSANNINSLVKNGNLLFLSLGNTSSNYKIQVYDMLNNKMVYNSNVSKAFILKNIPDLSITMLKLPADQNYNFTKAQFNYNGSLQNESMYTGPTIENNKNSVIEAISPLSKRFIITEKGYLFNSSSLVQLKTLSTNNTQFTSFVFNSYKKEILAATTIKTIEVYNETTYEKTNILNTRGHPMKLIKTADKIICISSTMPLEDNFSHSKNSFIETFEY